MLIVGTARAGGRIFLSTACTVFKEKGSYKWKMKERFLLHRLTVNPPRALHLELFNVRHHCKNGKVSLECERWESGI